MKKHIGSMAGFLAIMAVVLHSLFPLGPEAGGSRVNTQEKTSSETATTSNPKEAVELEGPWLATQAFFKSARKVVPITFDMVRPLLSTDALSDTRKVEKWRDVLGLPQKDNVQTWAIVATVADPAHSRMQLFFDGQIRSIENAVTKHEWEFAAQWLPWRDNPRSSSGRIDEQRRQRQFEHDQEALPGILVFRRGIPATGVLFVLLVAETPTAGVSGDAFYAALNLARILSSPGRKIGLLAPTFSGSFDSLTRFLVAWDQKNSGALFRTVYGGSVSSTENAKEFHKAYPSCFQFRSGIASSEAYKHAFREILHRYEIQPDKAAYWVEEESGFGVSFIGEARSHPEDSFQTHCPEGSKAAGTEDTDQKIAIYTFPREISHLRTAYQEATHNLPDNSRSASPKLEISLKDPSHGEDSIPLFSDTHTPLEQSAAISTVTEELRRERMRIVLIVASNTLDSLLLASFVRTESPDTRVLIGDADTLFIPAASQNSLSGTLFLSTYPMFILGQEWLTRGPSGEQGETNSHLIFPGPSQQGVFNVTQLLLAGIGAAALGKDDGDCLYGYRQLTPKEEEKDEYPGLWLLTLTNYGFLPVDWFSATKDYNGNWFERRSASNCTSKPAKAQSFEQRFPLDEPSRGWYIAAVGMILAIIVACFLLLSKPSFVARTWFPTLLGAGLSLSAAQWILLLPALQVLWREDKDHILNTFANRATLLIVALSMILPLLSLVWVNVGPGSAKRRGRRGKHRWSALHAAAIVLLFLFISERWLQANGGVWCVEQAHALLFRLRAIELFSTSSPALVLFVLSVVFSVGLVLYCFRYAEASTGISHLNPDRAKGRITSLVAAIDGYIKAPYSLQKGPFGHRFGICAALVAIVMCLVRWGMGAFELPAFNHALYTALAVLLFSMATTCYDLIAIWRPFKKFLTHFELERFPGKGAFERVTQHWPRRQVFGFGQALPRAVLDLRKKSDVSSYSDRVALDLCLYAVYVVRQIQLIGWSVGLGLLTLIAVLTAYPVQSPQLVGRVLAVLFVVIGGILIWVFGGMERNWVLSRIARTEPNELSFEFWVQAVAVAALPLIGILVHLFPSLGSFVSSWVAPSLEALR